jgi:hypothetical protein
MVASNLRRRAGLGWAKRIACSLIPYYVGVGMIANHVGVGMFPNHMGVGMIANHVGVGASVWRLSTVQASNLMMVPSDCDQRDERSVYLSFW